MPRPRLRPKDEGPDRPWQEGYRISESPFMDRSWRAVYGWPGTWVLASVAATVNAIANVADGSSEAGFTVGVAGLAYLALAVSLRYRDRGELRGGAARWGSSGARPGRARRPAARTP